MRFINLTPHEVRVGDKVFPASGEVARVETEVTKIGEVCGIPFVVQTNGDAYGLPDPVSGTMLIVSSQTMLACPDRADLCCPHGLVRDNDGRVVGCSGFAVNAEAWSRPGEGDLFSRVAGFPVPKPIKEEEE